MNAVLRFVLVVGAGTLLGGLMGWSGQCASGTCPLTSTWWRGALYGGFIGLLLALGGRPS